MKTVVIGLVGTTLDAGNGKGRWERWRPTVDLCRHEDLVVDRLELLCGEESLQLGERLKEDLAQVSPETEVRLHPLSFRSPWDFEPVYATLHAFARSYPFRPEQEQYLVHVTTGTHVMQICLFLLTETRYFPGKLLQTTPPPATERGQPGRYTIIDLDLSKYDGLASRFQKERAEATEVLKSGIATRNVAFNALISRIEQVAVGSRAPVLLTGPTGAGKSQLARRIYELKAARRQVKGPFVEVNCATLRGDGAMSALFGHVKGAFTGALQDRPGLLRSADGGVLFLDEIGELGSDEQAMLLRAIEDRQFLPVGSDRLVKSDFQLIAGTNRDLQAAVAEGRFREDLLARIDVWTFRLPGLRERPEDLEPNLDYELEEWAREHRTRVSFSREARAAFLAFATSPAGRWTRNFRDFRAAFVRMATLAPGGRITEEGVREEVERLVHGWSHEGAGRAAEAQEGGLESLLGQEGVAALDPFDRVQLQHVVQVCRESRTLSEAGRTLFAVSRTKKASSNDADRLRKYLERYGLTFDALQKRGQATFRRQLGAAGSEK